MAQNSKRGRHNNRRRQNPNNINRSMDSTGPEVKIRGTAAQIYEKYQGLARDAASAGDRIRGESLLQHAEHYYRLMREMQIEAEKREEARADRQRERQPEHQSDQAGGPQQGGEADATSAEDAKPAEDSSAASSDAPAADGDAEDGVEEPKQRRPRRRRTPRKAAEGDESGESDSSSDQPVVAD